MKQYKMSSYTMKTNKIPKNNNKFKKKFLKK